MKPQQASIPVYRPTLERVRQLKTDSTYDELINEMIDTYETTA